jgi:hypothetical protein
VIVIAEYGIPLEPPMTVELPLGMPAIFLSLPMYLINLHAESVRGGPPESESSKHNIELILILNWLPIQLLGAVFEEYLNDMIMASSIGTLKCSVVVVALGIHIGTPVE